MEKKIWSKPEMNEFAFAANEYVAACGDSGKKYLFECNAPRGTLNYYTDARVQENQGAPDDFSKYNRKWNYLPGVSYHPCTEKHTADASDDFFWGYIDYNQNGKHDTEEYTDDSGNVWSETVVVWVQKLFDLFGKPISNYHATNNLNINTWETQKS